MAATVTQSTSKDGKFTVIVESSFAYGSEIADVPTGEQTRYLLDDTTGLTSTIYRDPGMAYGSK